MRDITSSAVVPEINAFPVRDIGETAAPSASKHKPVKGGASKNAPLLMETSALSADRRLVLLDHQLECVSRFSGSGNHGSRLLAWDMRVGKTPAAIALDQQFRRDIGRQQRGNNCTLICAPKSALSMWEDHLLRMGVSPYQIRVVDLPTKKKIRSTLAFIAKNKRLKGIRDGYIVVNWDSVAPLAKELRVAGPWFHIVGDEIHRIKGRKTARTKAFLKLRCKQKTALSGTWVDNRPEDGWQVLNWLSSARFPSYWRFVDEVCTTEVNRKTGYKYITGVNESGVEKLHEQIADIYSRVRMSDVVAEMPPRTVEYWHVDMSVEQRRAYDELVKDDIASIGGGDVIASLPIVKIVREQQMAIGYCSGEWIKRKVKDPDGGFLKDSNGDFVFEDWFDVSITDSPPSPKLDAIMSWLEDSDNLEEPVVIGAQHPDTIRMLSERCSKAGITIETVTGNDGHRKRADAIGRFQSGDSRVFAGVIDCIREGIDLSRARTIIRIDRPWNPNWNRQFEARCDSQFDPQPTKVIDIIARDSIDEVRIDKIDRKAADTDLVVR